MFRFTPRVVYGPAPTTFNFTRPVGRWTFPHSHHGGGNVSGAGVPEAFTIRRGHKVRVPLRFTEAEWPHVDAWISYVLAAASSFEFWFDPDDASTAYTVYLDEPAPDTEWEPSRATLEELELQVVLRHVEPAPITVRFYD